MLINTINRCLYEAYVEVVLIEFGDLVFLV